MIGDYSCNDIVPPNRRETVAPNSRRAAVSFVFALSVEAVVLRIQDLCSLETWPENAH